ncbi:M13-type metalloendopeptidase [Sphingomicrobium arenosum]|uniref:M13-type metalloendopeptidase n=1 Tax=Sphingomicrobium arenosum TaxID=2233861 RepID=UPI002240F2DB|nr:M13 family metallopeptidase [Sphingomicrobium arenosum]
MRAIRSTVLAAAILTSAAAAARANPTPSGEIPALDLSIMDRSVDPGDDFYRYAAGIWLDTTSVPDGRRSLSGANAVAIDVDRTLAAIVEQAVASDPAPGTPAWRIKTLYDSYVAGDGTSPVAQQAVADGVVTIQKLDTHYDVARFMADPYSNSIAGVYNWIDAGNPSRRDITIDQQFFFQGALGLGDRSAYLDAEKAEALAAYRDYMAATFARTGLADGIARADAVVAFETALAEAMWTPDRMRDREANYRPMTMAELDAYAPGFSWRGWLDAVGIDRPERVILRQDSALRAAARIFADTPVEVLKDYLAFHWVDNHWSFLGADLREPALVYHYDDPSQRASTEQRAIGMVARYLGDDLSQLWVAENLDAARIERARAMGREMVAATGDWLRQAAWLSEETRTKSLDKLAGFTLKLGAPEAYRPVPADAVSSDFYESARALKMTAADLDWDGIGQPLPPQYWYAAKPFTVDAANAPDRRTLTITPAVIDGALRGQDPAVIYASAFVIGHEIGHSFDDQGSKFDPDGILQPWWTEASRVAYDAEVAKMARQIEAWEFAPGVTMKPEQVMGEALGDLIGLRIAERALDNYLAANPDEAGADASGYTAKQRFYLSYAQGFRTVWKPGALEEYVATQYHPPGEFRAIGILRNMDGWYDAFDIGPEDDLWLAPEARVRL